MMWNPFKLLQTLGYFRVAGSLKGIAEMVMPASAPISFPAPSIATPAVLTVGLSAAAQTDLAQALAPLAYRVEAAESLDQGAANFRQEWVNVPILVWMADTSEPAMGQWQQLVTQLSTTPAYSEATLIDFRHPTPSIQALWGSLDDVVMGGVSDSQVRWQEALVFTGQVSTANSGGFASIRTRNLEPPLSLAQWQGTTLYAQGDGQRYKWILRDSPGWDSLAHCRSFDTMTEQPITIRTPFLDMVATSRARTVPQAAPLNPAQICSMQLMLSKFEYDGDLNPSFQPGPFRLAISQVGMYRDAPKPLVVLPAPLETAIENIQPTLAAAGLTGIMPTANGFSLVGATRELPGWVDPEVVRQICQTLMQAI
ncbi:MAG: CIA30 family protein [Nodosilinea sp.]